MSAPPRADFVVGCPDCGQTKEADSFEAVARFYATHKDAGHDVEWLWGKVHSLDVEPEVTDAGTVANLRSVIAALGERFGPARVPGELVYETCVSAGASKSSLDAQFEDLPPNLAERVTHL